MNEPDPYTLTAQTRLATLLYVTYYTSLIGIALVIATIGAIHYFGLGV